MPTSYQVQGTSHHVLWHHLAMVVITEINNLLWLFGAGLAVIGGFALFNFTNSVFFKLVVGLPLILGGAGVVIFKIHEIILVIVRPKRLEVLCKFCQD